MSHKTKNPNAFFKAEFGEGDFAKRLWRGGLRASPEGYELIESPHLLTTALRNGLDVRFTDDNKLESIISDIETSWNDADRLRRACRPIVRSQSRLYSVSSASLIKHILSVDLFQPPIITCLINKISELGEENSSDRDIAPILLNQLRWLDFVVDGASLTKNLLSILPIVLLSLQKEIVESIPEIIDDSSKPQAVSEFIRILEESPSLMGSVIDALASLGVDDERLLNVNSSIIATIGAANRDILPITIKYLVRTCPSDLLTPTVDALRNTLALPSLGPGPGKLCLDAIKYGLRMSKSVAQHVLKVLRNLDKSALFKPADFWLVTALYDSPINRKQTEVLFRRKSALGAFTRALMDAALAPFADGFADQTKLMIMLASVVVKSPEIGARRSGVSLYALLFKLFASGNTRRNVITSLAEHIGTRKVGEVDTALDALVLIAEEAVEDRSLLPYSGAIQNLLDFLECFTDSQLRQVWRVLGYICCASEGKHTGNGKSANEHEPRPTVSSSQLAEAPSDGSGGGELQMLEILLRKELRHPDTFYRRIGVIGACTMIKVLGSGLENNILSMLLEVGRAHPVSQAIAFDELAELFGQSNTTSRGTSESLRKTISTLFERKYLMECSGLCPLVKDEKLLPAKLFGNLEGNDVELCFSIASLTRNESTLDESLDVVRSMAPNLRLLCVLTSNRFHGSLSDIDATIGAPLHIPVFPEGKDLDDICSEGRIDLLLNMFIAHGWIVELINGFAGQESNELRAKCVLRVDNLLDITAQISKLIPHVPRWKEVIFDAYNGTRLALSPAKQNGPKKKKAGQDGTNTGSGADKNTEWKAMSRQLDSSALALISIRNPITWRYTETETLLRDGDPEVQTATLSVESLHYLLTELAGQVENVVGGLFQDSTLFSVIMFHTGSLNAVKKDSRGGARESSADTRLKKMRSFRLALESLGSQFSLCLEKVISNEETAELLVNEATIKLYRECAVLCLKSLSLTLNSAVLNDKFAQELLFDLLASMRLDGQPPVQSSDPVSQDDVAIAAKIAFEQLYNRMNSIASEGADVMSDEDETISCLDQLEFDGCCGILAVLDSIFQHCSERQKSLLGPKLSKIAYILMKHNWPEAKLRMRKSQRLIPGIVRVQVQYASDSLAEADRLREMITKFAEKQAAPENGLISTQDQTHIRASIPGIFGSLIEQTSFAYSVAIIDQYIFMFKTFKPGSFENVEDAFKRMSRFIRAEQPLYSLARLNQRLLSPVMRGGRIFVELFLKICLPFLNEKFKHHQSEVVQLCKSHQKPTRLLQSFCAHSKSIQDTSLTGLVPPLRRCLELLLYQVKGLLHGHNATNAFQLGNLKHRDIHGELVNSQQIEEEDQEEANDNENGDDAPGGVVEEDNMEQLVLLTEIDADESPSLPKGSRRGQKKSGQLLGSGKRKKQKLSRSQKQSKISASSTKERSSIVRDLDYGSGVDNENVGTEKQRGEDYKNHDTDRDDLLNSDLPLDTTGENNDSDRDDEAIIRRGRASRGALRERPKSTQQMSRVNWDPFENEDVTQRRRCPLIDDEAGEAGSYEEDADEADLASQFIVGDDEVEE